jgi:DNA (cytosine-5)-methyltransferase 1
MTLTVGSVCSGIGAPETAWAPLGWEFLWSAEIEPFPSAVLAARFQGLPNLGDMTTIAPRILAGEIAAPDILVGGTPCQSFSVAGLRGGLSDERGNLALEFVRLAEAIDAVRFHAGKPPAWILWENVPGVLSDAGNAFGTFLAGLVGGDAPLVPRGRWTDAGVVAGPLRCAAWRVMDAQFFGLAQRRERVFVLARGGAARWSCADALLPVIEGVRWHPAPRREAREGIAGSLTQRADRGGTNSEGTDGHLIARCVTTGEGSRQDGESCTFIAHTLRADGFDASEDGTGRGTPLVAVAGAICRDSFSGGAGGRPEGAAAGHYIAAQPVVSSGRGWWDQSEVGATIRAQDSVTKADTLAVQGMAVRRLTPRECERLQGFPDDATAVVYRAKPAADGPRYRAIGNSMAVPVLRWIGEQIEREHANG